MPSLQIYLNQELFDFVRQDKSRIIQKALKEYIARRENKKYPCSPDPAALCSSDTPEYKYSDMDIPE